MDSISREITQGKLRLCCRDLGITGGRSHVCLEVKGDIQVYRKAHPQFRSSTKKCFVRGLIACSFVFPLCTLNSEILTGKNKIMQHTSLLIYFYMKLCFSYLRFGFLHALSAVVNNRK